MGLLGLVIALFCYFTYTRWQNTFTLKTGVIGVRIVAYPRDETVMQNFVEELRARTRVYPYSAMPSLIIRCLSNE